MLLKIKGWTKKGSAYPTMFMIISRLLANLAKTLSCFQYDSLWKSMKTASNRARTHDLYDQKGVRRKMGRSLSLFSIGYGQEKEGNGAVEPTICMVAKDFAENRRFPTIKYVVENRTRSPLAAGHEAFGTHDAYDA